MKRKSNDTPPQQPEPLRAPEPGLKAPDAKGRFGPVSAVLVMLGAFFGSQIAAGVIIGGILSLSGKKSEDAVSILDSTAGRFVFVLVVEIITAAVIFWFMRRRKISLAEIGLGRLPRFRDMSWALAGFAFYFVLAAVVMYFIGRFAPGINLEQQQQIGFENVQGALPLLLVFVSLVVLPPIVEEIMIRGFLYSGLRRRLGRVVSALTASAVFGAAHLQLGSGAPPLYVAAIDTFVLSMVLIAVREKTGSLWGSMIVHAIKNGLAFTALFVFNAT